MGVNCTTPVVEPDYSKFLEKYGDNQKKAKQLLQKHGLIKQQSYNLVHRIFTYKQNHLLEHLDSMATNKQKKNFLATIELTNIELLDSLYYKLLKDNSNQQFKVKEYKKIGKMLNTQEYSQVGYDMIKNNKVALLILLAGRNYRFGEDNREMFKIPMLPSKKCLLQLILERCDSLGALLEIKLNVIIVLNNHKVATQKYIMAKKFANLCLKIIIQHQIGLLDKQGRIILKTQCQPYFNPNGTGDFLPNLHETGALEFLIKNGIQYLQVIPCNNLLENPFSCAEMGYAKKHNLQILGKCVEGNPNSKCQSRIVEVNGSIYIIDSKEYEHYRELHKLVDKEYRNAKTFTNNMIFKVKFLDEILENQGWNYAYGRCYRAKKEKLLCYNVESRNYKTQQVNLFEKDFTDLLLFSTKFQIIQVPKQEYYAQVVHLRKGQDGLGDAVAKLFARFKKWLKLQDKDPAHACQISPYISLWGENLQQILEQLRHQKIQFPLYIHDQ